MVVSYKCEFHHELIYCMAKHLDAPNCMNKLSNAFRNLHYINASANAVTALQSFCTLQTLLQARNERFICYRPAKGKDKVGLTVKNY